MRLYIITTVIIVAAVVLSAYILTNGFRAPSSTGPDILIPAGTGDAIPAGQFDAVVFQTGSNAQVTGVVSNSFGLVIFLMNPDQFNRLIATLNDSLYVWTSGPLANGTLYNLSLTVEQAGIWDLVFFNTSVLWGSAAGFLTNLVLST